MCVMSASYLLIFWRLSSGLCIACTACSIPFWPVMKSLYCASLDDRLALVFQTLRKSFYLRRSSVYKQISESSRPLRSDHCKLSHQQMKIHCDMPYIL
ncbi:hypothetical protein BDR06DRAFT_503777 [Suillus hirtellus]|nr:hypothetical protein BDR06DRAFT_503777 [Suillus hirtellus]